MCGKCHHPQVWTMSRNLITKKCNPIIECSCFVAYWMSICIPCQFSAKVIFSGIIENVKTKKTTEKIALRQLMKMNNCHSLQFQSLAVDYIRACAYHNRSAQERSVFVELNDNLSIKYKHAFSRRLFLCCNNRLLLCKHTSIPPCLPVKLTVQLACNSFIKLIISIFILLHAIGNVQFDYMNDIFVRNYSAVTDIILIEWISLWFTPYWQYSSYI